MFRERSAFGRARLSIMLFPTLGPNIGSVPVESGNYYNSVVAALCIVEATCLVKRNPGPTTLDYVGSENSIDFMKVMCPFGCGLNLLLDSL